MKWKNVKEIIETMTDKELEQDAIVLSEDLVVSNSIQQIKKSEHEVFIDQSEDYGSTLINFNEIKEGDIDMYEHYYSKGHFIALF